MREKRQISHANEFQIIYVDPLPPGRWSIAPTGSVSHVQPHPSKDHSMRIEDRDQLVGEETWPMQPQPGGLGSLQRGKGGPTCPRYDVMRMALHLQDLAKAHNIAPVQSPENYQTKL